MKHEENELDTVTEQENAEGETFSVILHASPNFLSIFVHLKISETSFFCVAIIQSMKHPFSYLFDDNTTNSMATSQPAADFDIRARKIFTLCRFSANFYS